VSQPKTQLIWCLNQFELDKKPKIIKKPAKLDGLSESTHDAVDPGETQHVCACINLTNSKSKEVKNHVFCPNFFL
jgi:hypothetical protein